MIYEDLILAKKGGPGALRFSWDTETGEVTGQGADVVRFLAADALESGHVAVQPYPQTMPVTDPLHMPGELFAILAHLYDVPPELRDLIPEQDDGAGAPDGAVF